VFSHAFITLRARGSPVSGQQRIDQSKEGLLVGREVSKVVILL
jgi:hypothetical protein